MANPTLVSNVKARIKSNRIFMLSWDANPVSENVNVYDIYQSETNYGNFSLVTRVNAPTLTADIHVPVTAPPSIIWWWKVIGISATYGSSVSGNDPNIVVDVGQTLILNINNDGNKTIILDTNITGATIASDIQTKVRSLTATTPTNQAAYTNFICTYTSIYTLTSGLIGSNSSVVVVGGTSYVGFKLGITLPQGGVETAGTEESGDLTTSEAEATYDEEIFVRNPFDQTIPQLGEVKEPQTDNNQVEFSPYQTLPDLSKVEQRWMLEIRKRHKWILQMGGTKCKLFKRKWSGTRCSRWDPLRKTEDPSPNDIECFGTGFVGGYNTSIDILVSFVSPTAKVNRSMEYGMWFEYEPKCWGLWEPNFLDRDIIVNVVTGERFEIVNVTKTNWRGLPLRQQFDVKLIETTSIIYKIPLV